jgi:hypothetical protein
MYVNVILSFKNANAYGDTQEFFDLHLPINKNEKDAESFFDRKLFKRIAAKCKLYGRNVKDLYKISTASNWDLFEQVTGKSSLWSLGHDCKWYFNDDINELDEWERCLKQDFNFGMNI